jgi:hypothetical protein
MSALGSAAGIAISYSAFATYSAADSDLQQFADEGGNTVVPETNLSEGDSEHPGETPVADVADAGYSVLGKILFGAVLLGGAYYGVFQQMKCIRRRHRRLKFSCDCCGLSRTTATLNIRKCGFCSHTELVTAATTATTTHTTTPLPTHTVPTNPRANHSETKSRDGDYDDNEIMFHVRPAQPQTQSNSSNLNLTTSWIFVEQQQQLQQEQGFHKLDSTHCTGKYSAFVQPGFQISRSGLEATKRHAMLRAVPDSLDKIRWFRIICLKRRNHLWSDRTMFNRIPWKLTLNRCVPTNGVGNGDDYLLESSFNRVSLRAQTSTGEPRPIELWRPFTVDILQDGIHVGGTDMGGVTREWFEITGRELFSCKHGLFKDTIVEGERCLYVREDSEMCNEDHLQYFKFAGRMIAMALIHNHTMPAPLCDYIWKLIVDEGVGFNQVASLDVDLYKFLRQLQNIDDVEACDLEFKYTSQSLGREIEIVLNDDDSEENSDKSCRLVTSNNRDSFVRKWTRMALIGRCEVQLLSLLQGVYELIPPNILSIFSSSQLKSMVCGQSGPIDVEDWKTHTVYRPTSAQNSQIVRWFWLCVSNMTAEEKSNLLRFCTSSSSVPAGGFRNVTNKNGKPMKFRVEIKRGDLNAVALDSELPEAHTCFHAIILPNYTNIEALREGLIICLQNNVGFGFE